MQVSSFKTFKYVALLFMISLLKIALDCSYLLQSLYQANDFGLTTCLKWSSWASYSITLGHYSSKNVDRFSPKTMLNQNQKVYIACRNRDHISAENILVLTKIILRELKCISNSYNIRIKTFQISAMCLHRMISGHPVFFVNYQNSFKSIEKCIVFFIRKAYHSIHTLFSLQFLSVTEDRKNVSTYQIIFMQRFSKVFMYQCNS